MLMFAAMRPDGHRRVLGEVLRAEQPLLFGRDRGEEDASAAARLGSAAKARATASIAATPGGVVDRAVVDGVLARLRVRLRARGDRGARCRAPPRSASFGSLPGQHARARWRSACAAPSFVKRVETRHARAAPGWKSRVCAAARSASRSLPAERDEPPRGLFGGPRLHLQRAGSPRGGQLELLARPRRLHHLPRVARADGVVWMMIAPAAPTFAACSYL